MAFWRSVSVFADFKVWVVRNLNIRTVFCNPFPLCYINFVFVISVSCFFDLSFAITRVLTSSVEVHCIVFCFITSGKYIFRCRTLWGNETYLYHIYKKKTGKTTTFRQFRPRRRSHHDLISQLHIKRDDSNQMTKSVPYFTEIRMLLL